MHAKPVRFAGLMARGSKQHASIPMVTRQHMAPSRDLVVAEALCAGGEWCVNAMIRLDGMQPLRDRS